MSSVQRQMLWGIGFSFVMFLFLTGSYFYVHPFGKWSEFWERELMDIPFILFAATVSLSLGLIFGLILGMYWRKQIQTVDNWLFELEEGRLTEFKPGMLPEFDSISERMQRVHKQMAEKAKLAQRLANEKAEEQETKIQEMISQERNRLARELHDSVSQQLFAASMMMSAINETRAAVMQGEDIAVQLSVEREAKQLKMVEEMIHQSQLEMRALLLHLRPVALKGKSLQEGIEELLIELQQKVTMDIQSKIEPFQVDKGVEDHLFRILQESVSNTLRHSKASKLEVLLIKRDEMVIMRVSDDGVGFDVDESKAGSYGLQNMYERAGEVGGTLKIVSVKNKGTKLEVKVPILDSGRESKDD
ncbi:sensor histidine kinase [Mesobacillus maritimus]|uniref:sensor histidine kinase n=1 Tax=Mesobacillus maritimus TaxID=1643336 RepID=UPI00203F8739|nr:sensor histidine kinase [Mesobacillus maritimus]MCM3585517.1 sensor histidine kinase [Mesobacillus maritimus]MCM3669777.1 sensor histidine kinase [Mesobacillus maritimus]